MGLQNPAQTRVGIAEVRLIVLMPRHFALIPPVWITKLELTSIPDISSVSKLPPYALARASEIDARSMPHEFTPSP